MKQAWLLVLSCLAWAAQLQAQGIDFFHGTWEEAKAKAKAENKLLFVDTYASWCGPCKWMAANAFPDASVGEHFNKYFINVKMDMEKGEGPSFAQKYPVSAYPTLMFINGDGKKMHEEVGAQDAAGLLEIGKAVQTKFGKTPINNNNNNNNNGQNTNGGGSKAIGKKYSYDGGSFQTKDTQTWIEYARDGQFNFKLYSVDDTYFYIKDESRGVEVAMPRQGGVSYILRDGEWDELYQVQFTSN